MTNATITKRSQFEEDKASAAEFLKKVFAAQDRPEIFTILRHVSSSGMTRDISLITTYEGQIINITWYAAQVMKTGRLVDSKGFNAIRVGGCGMDMGFHLVYSLCLALYGLDGGYKVNQRWL